MTRRRSIDILRSHLEDDVVDEVDPSVESLLLAARQLEALAAEDPGLDPQHIWTRIEPQISRQRQRSARVPMPYPRLRQLRLPEWSWPAMARATAAAFAITFALVIALGPTSRTASAEFLHSVESIAALNHLLPVEGAEQNALLVSLDHDAARLVALLDRHPGLLADLTPEDLARASSVIEAAWVLLAGAPAGDGWLDAVLVQRTIANLQDIANRISAALTADVLAEPPDTASVVSENDTAISEPGDPTQTQSILAPSPTPAALPSGPATPPPLEDDELVLESEPLGDPSGAPPPVQGGDEPGAEPGSDAGGEPVAEPGSGAEEEPVAEPGPGAEEEPVAEPGPGVEEEPEAEPQSDIEDDPGLEVDVEPDGLSIPDLSLPTRWGGAGSGD